MKSSSLIILVAICAMALSSCSIVRGLTTDGKNGPDIFSFEKREVDTIANGEYIFRFADYLSERVWKPLGMGHPAVINIDSRKHDNAHTFGGISTTIKDLAKIGRLYLNNGMWDGKRIVSEDWIRQTTDCDTTYHGYHFNWYNINYENYIRPEYSGYYALGICEQVLYVNPYKNLIMVRIGLHNHGYTRIPVLFEQLSGPWPVYEAP